MTLQTPESILWMVEKLKANRGFRYEEWSDRFRPGKPLMFSREDRRFHRHLQFFRETVLELLAGTGTTLEADRSDGTYRIVRDTSIGDGWASLGDSQWADFFPLLSAMNRQPTLIPFSVGAIEKQLQQLFDLPDGISEHVFFKTSSARTVEPRLLRVLFDAWHQGCRVRIVPQPPRMPVSADPVFLVAFQGNWHLLAEAGDWALQYNLARVQTIELLPEEGLRKISKKELSDYRGRLECIYGISFINPETGVPDEPIVATVRFSGGAKTVAIERYSQALQDGDSVIVTFKVHALYELISDLLAWGPDAEPLEPPELREEWLDKISQFIPLLKDAGRV